MCAYRDYLELIINDQLCQVLMKSDDVNVSRSCLLLAHLLLRQPDLYWCFKDVDEEQAMRGSPNSRPKMHLVEIAFECLHKWLHNTLDANADAIATLFEYVHQLLETIVCHKGGELLILHSRTVRFLLFHLFEDRVQLKIQQILIIWLKCLRLLHFHRNYAQNIKLSLCTVSLRLLLRLRQNQLGQKVDVWLQRVKANEHLFLSTFERFKTETAPLSGTLCIQLYKATFTHDVEKDFAKTLLEDMRR